MLIASESFSAKLASSCSMDANKLEVSGNNLDTLLPLASVSKIYTALMAVTAFNLDYKFYTQIFVTPVATNVFDVHIKGARDPYFNKFKMHMIISKLNEMNVTQIRNLTFDENVKYLHETDSSRGFRAGSTLIQPLILKADLNFPNPEIVKHELSQTSVILKSYKDSFKLARAMIFSFLTSLALKFLKKRIYHSISLNQPFTFKKIF